LFDRVVGFVTHVDVVQDSIKLIDLCEGAVVEVNLAAFTANGCSLFGHSRAYARR